MCFRSYQYFVLYEGGISHKKPSPGPENIILISIKCIIKALQFSLTLSASKSFEFICTRYVIEMF